MSGMLPSFEKSAGAPMVEGASGITLALDGAAASSCIAHGAWRVTAAERGSLAREPLRAQVWIVVTHRATRALWTGRPGADAIVLAGEEPAAGGAEGWFHVRLADCCALPADLVGVVDAVAVLGPHRSAVASAGVEP